MPWNTTPCDVEARSTNGRLLGRSRTSRVNNRSLRRAWSKHHGQSWPIGMCACHHCDDQRCSNVLHIFPGTQSENIRDAHCKGRMVGVFEAGERHAGASLTEDLVSLIKDRFRGGDSQRVLAREYGVNQSTISRIVNGLRWGGGSNALESGQT